jgi:hypothetical protein
MKYKVTLYQEIYTHLEIEAKSEDEARDLVLSGEFDDANTIDIEVEVKESEIIDSEEIKE